MQNENGSPLPERLARLEARFDHFDERMEKLDLIHETTIKNTAMTVEILRHLDSNKDIAARLTLCQHNHDSRMATIENKLQIFDGTEHRPSFETLQDSWLRRKAITGIAALAWGTIIAVLMVAVGWLNWLIPHEVSK